MNNLVSRLSWIAVVTAALVACGDEDDPGPIGRLDAGDVTDADASVAPPSERRFRVDVLAGLNSAAQFFFPVARIAPSGRPAVAFGTAGVGPGEIRLAELTESDTWTTETAVVPAEDDEEHLSKAPRGVGFDFVDGLPHIAYTGGDDDDQVINGIGLGDLHVAWRDGAEWRDRKLVNGSAEAGGECLDPANYCVEGTEGQVGLFPHLRAGPEPGQYAITYKDDHFGFGGEADPQRADLEIFEAGPGAQHLMVDGGRSGGERSTVAFLPDGRSVVAYTLDLPAERVSVWVAIEGDGDYERIKVSDHSANHRISLDIGPDNSIWMAYYEDGENDLIVASSTDLGATWDLQRVDERGDVGLHPSLVVGPDGTVYVAYTYCDVASNTECPGNLARDSVVRLATRAPGATDWTIQVVDDGQGRGEVGEFNSLVVFPDGKVGVAFIDQRNSDLIFALEIN